MEEELLDLVDQNDNVIEKKRRSEVYAGKMHNFRVVNAFVRNSKGELWIPRRTAEKSIFPLCLDMSMGGHVKSGETYEDAFRRETNEELNIDVSKSKCALLGKLTPQDNDVSAFMKVWEIRLEEVSDYNKNDFLEFYWITPKELMERISVGEKTKSDLPKLVRIFYKNEIR